MFALCVLLAFVFTIKSAYSITTREDQNDQRIEKNKSIPIDFTHRSNNRLLFKLLIDFFLEEKNGTAVFVVVAVVTAITAYHYAF